jgi:hypothetical protein
MRWFQELGADVHARWKRVDFDEAAFAEVAGEALVRRQPVDHVSPDDVIEWVHTAPALVPQRNVDLAFGQPPVTVFSDPRFYIEVLFWVDGSTTIHSHGFSGAFHVLAGASLEASYQFEPQRRYSSHLLTGALSLERARLLASGDTRPIVAGREAIHSLFHLERPSVTVVVRTYADSTAGPQYNFSPPGIAHNVFHRPPALVLQQRTLDLLAAIEHPSLEARARATIADADAFTAHALLDHLVDRLEPHDRYRAFLDSLGPAHADLVEMMRAASEAKLRTANLVGRRARIHRPEHRLFLALLLNLPDRASVLEIVRQAHPEAPPTATIARWVEELSQLPGLPDEPNALGLAMTDGDLAVFRHLLEGATDAQVVGRLREEYSAEAVAAVAGDIADMCRALRDSFLFRPLFA